MHERMPGLNPKVPCLGTGDYACRVIARRTPTSAPKPVGELPVDSGSFNRGVDTITSASVTMGLTSGCCDVLSKINPLRHELEIFRDSDMVWCGPIRDVTVDEEAGTASLAANDLAYWFNLRAFRHTMQPEGIDLAYIFEGYANYALGRGLPEWGKFFEGDPPTGRVLASGEVRPARPADPPLYADDFGLALHVFPCGVTGERTVYKGDLKVVWSELEELAQTGVDFTVINREMLIGGIEVTDDGSGDPIVLPGRLTDDLFDTPMRLRRTGEGMATEVLTRANGFKSRVGGPADDGVEITRVLDEYSIEDQASADAAALSYYERGKDPLVYVEGSGAMSPSAPVQFQQLVPGMRVRVLFEGAGCMTFGGGMRLDGVAVSWDEQGEKVTPTLQPLGVSGADARGAGG
jgi:hypothetical protein